MPQEQVAQSCDMILCCLPHKPHVIANHGNQTYQNAEDMKT